MAILTFKHRTDPSREELLVDSAAARVARLRRRVNAWVIAMWELKKVREVSFWKVLLTYGDQEPVIDEDGNDTGFKQSPWSLLIFLLISKR